jgi:RNA polymerase sigma factor (TIGR02999 family)
MQSRQPNEVTQLLVNWSHGNKAALDQLMPVVYQELRKLASGFLKGERPDHTLQPTALIHEAYLRLINQDLPEWQNRAHFFGVAARLMRQILVDHARRHGTTKRGGDQLKLSLDDAPLFSQDQIEELVVLDDLLNQLTAFDERKSRIVEMRAFGGMSLEETAEALGVSVPTVKRETRLALAWLHREMKKQ